MPLDFFAPGGNLGKPFGDMTQVDLYPFKKYVLALGPGRDVPPGQSVNDRYWVLSPGVWQDTQAPEPPAYPTKVTPAALPYLKAYPHQLHVPTVYGECQLPTGPVLLLDNVPVDRHGRLMPTLGSAWASAKPFRQVYWCWQLFTLWPHLFGLEMAATLTAPEAIHIDGWRIRLSNLIPGQPPLKALADLIASLLPKASPLVATSLQPVLDRCSGPQPNFDQILEHLNRALLTQAMGISLTTEVAGSTSSGQQPQNEDACYPSQVELERASTADLPSLPRIAIVCDGVGGHAGGEIASQMVVRSLQLQLRGLLAEALEQEEPLPPYVVMGQIEAAIRVANNLVASQNDSQGRTERQRMGTTLVVAVMVPQRIPTPEGPRTVNELYVAHVGDSRAYWITPEACHLLTIDDDVAGREITNGSYPTAARARDDAGALTQALGTREADNLTPHIERFILDETGILLLCSDGLSDHQRVETSWANYIGLIVKNIVPLPTAVESWVELANQKNGHDNIAVVLMHCTVDGETVIVDDMPPPPSLTEQGLGATELTAASRALLYGESEEPAEIGDAVMSDEAKPRRLQALVLSIVLLIAVSMAGVIGMLLWQNSWPAPDENFQDVPTTEPDS
ncbi:PP2C family protein-serine/threonine phosphatase [Leptothoe sp. PORK10 BA2]|uniref:PP2C family protein-serine/threonine phosphatase n=1 Tax=Leptothoe sp. PORK10 BA2 TaxID=3110254 RepID=UPI002B1ED7C6|nr:PP2C family serine/threonine-protein phosphatase [Leptothoe sp. PORK10 BA2]MEA5465765.1 PP2C family serine/threonine-protein phosphatase [Leptothoe sp. PORK10 BA2]